MIRYLVFLSMLWSIPASAGFLQDALDALPSSGGVVELPCGTFDENGALVLMNDNVTIRGSGPCTVIPQVTGVRNSWDRQYSLRVESLIVDGNLSNGYIGIDFRNVTGARIRDVSVRNVVTAIFFSGDALYNLVEDSFLGASSTCLEILNGANENTVRGGKCQAAQIGALIYGANNVSIERMAFEVVSTAVHLGRDARATKLFGLRIEDADIGIDQRRGADQTVMIGIYLEAVGVGLIDRSGGQYFWYGPPP